VFPPSVVATPDADRPVSDAIRRNPWGRDDYNEDRASINQVGGSEDGLMGTDFDMMNTVGQTWLWDNATW